jgi:ribose transport system ATP-binding protein
MSDLSEAIMVASSASRGEAPLLEMRSITKAFGAVVVLRDVSLSCRAGEVHAICGENGAGKSTLMKVLGGVHAHDGGEILIAGARVRLANPAAARRAGIALIHQELALLPHRTVADNIFLGREPSRFGLVDRRAMNAAAESALRRVGSSIDADALCGSLSLAERQVVEIAKAVSLDARILVFDEPTAALDDVESEKLFGLMAELRSAGVAMLYISHRMAEVMRLADRISVIKDGQLVETLPAAAATVDGLVRAMVGRALSDFYPHAAERAPGDLVLAIEGGGNAALVDIDFEIRAGEIVGVAGLEASGKMALARALFGEEPLVRGRATAWDGLPAPRSPRHAVRRGIGYLTDDRKREGLGLRQSLRDNAALGLRSMAWALSSARKGAADHAHVDAMLDRVDVRANNFSMDAGSLSGGNQQKVLVARWLARKPRLLIICEPTRGVDVGARECIYRLLRDYADAGGAIVLVSSDVAEIIGMSDRICVMALGRIVAHLPRGASEEAIIKQAVRHDGISALPPETLR